MKLQYILAISGFKNCGKTTVIQNIIPLLTKHNLKVATIKHDGHDFEPDVPNTDTFKHRKSGACGVAIFSDNKFMVTKEISVNVDDILEYFTDADIILLEGFKDSKYDKLEIIKSDIYGLPYCKDNVLGYITDVNLELNNNSNVPIFKLNDYELIVEFILQKAKII